MILLLHTEQIDAPGRVRKHYRCYVLICKKLCQKTFILEQFLIKTADFMFELVCMFKHWVYSLMRTASTSQAAPLRTVRAVEPKRAANPWRP